MIEQTKPTPIGGGRLIGAFRSNPKFSADGVACDGTINVLRSVRTVNKHSDGLIDVMISLNVDLTEVIDDDVVISANVLDIKIRYKLDRVNGMIVPVRPGCAAFIEAEVPFSATKVLVANMKDDFVIEVSPENIRTIFSSSTGFILADEDEDGKAAFNEVANFILADFIRSGYGTEGGNLRMYCTSLSASEVR